MRINGKDCVVIYLTDWQMRMVEDFCGDKNCRVWIVPINQGGVGVKYLGPHDRDNVSGAKRMYLTEWQKIEIKNEANEDCIFVELTEAVHPRYNGPLPLREVIDSKNKVSYSLF